MTTKQKTEDLGPTSHTTPASATPATHKQSTLIEWANQQDHWIRALVSEAINTRQELADERVQHYYELMLREKELAAGTVAGVPMLSGSLNGSGVHETFLLTALEGVANVNALTTAQRIDFNPRMTILFG